MGQESGCGIAGCCWLKVFPEVADKAVIGVACSFEGWEKALSKFTHVIVGRPVLYHMGLPIELVAWQLAGPGASDLRRSERAKPK